MKKGEKAEIIGLYLSPDLKDRLNRVGITKGAVIGYLRPAPLGDPKIFIIRGIYYALRREVTDRIIVKKAGKEE